MMIFLRYEDVESQTQEEIQSAIYQLRAYGAHSRPPEYCGRSAGAHSGTDHQGPAFSILVRVLDRKRTHLYLCQQHSLDGTSIRYPSASAIRRES